MTQSTKPFRLMFRFWLDMAKPEEMELAETIETLKQERSFSRAVRQGLRLWVSLRQRDTTVLFELFPWIKEQLTGNPDGNDDDDIKKELQDLKRLLSAPNTQNTLILPPTPNHQMTGKIAAHSNPTVEGLGDGLEIKEARSNGESTANFIAAMSRLQGWESPQQEPSGGPKQIAGASAPLPPPSFDDSELLAMEIL